MLHGIIIAGSWTENCERYLLDWEPLWDRATLDRATRVGHPSATRNVGNFSACTPSADLLMVSPQPNRGFKGRGPAPTEGDNKYVLS